MDTKLSLLKPNDLFHFGKTKKRVYRFIKSTPHGDKIIYLTRDLHNDKFREYDIDCYVTKLYNKEHELGHKCIVKT